MIKLFDTNNRIGDIGSALPRKSGSKNFEPISSTIDNSITPKAESVKNDKNTVTYSAR